MSPSIPEGVVWRFIGMQLNATVNTTNMNEPPSRLKRVSFMEIQLIHALHSWNVEIQLIYKSAVRTGVEAVVMEIQPYATRGVSAMVGRLCIICPPKGDYIYNHPHAAEPTVIQLENWKGSRRPLAGRKCKNTLTRVRARGIMIVDDEVGHPRQIQGDEVGHPIKLLELPIGNFATSRTVLAILRGPAI